jgi:acetyl-CoA C-acetyltransferase
MTAFLLDGVRVPFGRLGGALSDIPTVDLGALPVAELIRRHPIARTPDAALFGVVVQATLGQNPGRIAALRGGVAPTTPGVTLNSVCLASLEAVCDATRRIAYGEGGSYLVGGVDSMSQAPRDLLMRDGLECAITGQSMGVVSDEQNRMLGISRDDQDDWAHLSHQRAAAARDLLLSHEVVPVSTPQGVHRYDEGVRVDSRREALGALPAAFSAEGTLTAGNSSQMADGASAGLVVDHGVLERQGNTPLGRIVDWSFVAGPDTGLHLKPAQAIRRILDKQHLTVADIDVYEINEAFAGVTLASMRELGLPSDVVNVHGGAVAIGHPLGASGFRLLLTAALAMRRRGGRRAIAALCGGGGQGLALLVEAAD